MHWNRGNEAVVLRDRSGVWYLLTAEALAHARSAAEPHAAELDDQLGDGVAFSIIRSECRDRLPFHVEGTFALPVGRCHRPAGRAGIELRMHARRHRARRGSTARAST
jgi:hypothetical protein